MKRKIVGPRMADAASYVRSNPGCSKLAVAEFVGPHSSRRRGYEIVNRAIGAGLIVAQPVHASRYALYPPVNTV